MAEKALFPRSPQKLEKEVWLSKHHGGWEVLSEEDDQLTNAPSVRSAAPVQEAAEPLDVIRRLIERSNLDEALRACGFYIDAQAHLSAQEARAEGLHQRAGDAHTHALV